MDSSSVFCLLAGSSNTTTGSGEELRNHAWFKALNRKMLKHFFFGKSLELNFIHVSIRNFMKATYQIFNGSTKIILQLYKAKRNFEPGTANSLIIRIKTFSCLKLPSSCICCSGHKICSRFSNGDHPLFLIFCLNLPQVKIPREKSIFPHFEIFTFKEYYLQEKNFQLLNICVGCKIAINYEWRF